MNKNERDELLAYVREQSTSDSTHRGSRPEDEYLAATADVADLLWETAHGAPALSIDPVAALLGLVPDSKRALDGKSLARARKRAGLTVGQLALRLEARGWEVQSKDVFRWETRSTADVAPAVINAIAEETGAQVDTLLLTAASRSDESKAVAHVKQSSAFQALVDRWAALQSMSRDLAESALESRMLATVHRGDNPDTDQMLQSLESLVATMETREGKRP